MREDFAERLADTTNKVRVAKNGNKIMFLLTDGFRFLDEEKGMGPFADWLRYYNNLDVAPRLEALERMRAFYTEKGIDILKDAISIAGVKFALPAPRCSRSGRGALQPQQRNIRGGERSCCRGAEPRVHAVPRSWGHKDQVSSGSGTPSLREYPGLRRQCSLPVDSGPFGEGKVVHYNGERRQG